MAHKVWWPITPRKKKRRACFNGFQTGRKPAEFSKFNVFYDPQLCHLPDLFSAFWIGFSNGSSVMGCRALAIGVGVIIWPKIMDRDERGENVALTHRRINSIADLQRDRVSWFQQSTTAFPGAFSILFRNATALHRQGRSVAGGW